MGYFMNFRSRAEAFSVGFFTAQRFPEVALEEVSVPETLGV